MILLRIDGATGAQAHCLHLAEKINEPLAFESYSLPLRASIGLAIFPDDSDCLEILIDKADQAMYEAKRKSKFAGRVD